jgi:lipoate-protein ligase A
MAVDEALLGDAAENGVATLRLYQWSEPTLSLGYFQQYDDRHQHTASRECPCVRRQTGGGAILHDRELTYSLALPASHPLAKQTNILYTSIHEAFIAELMPMVMAGDSRRFLASRDQESTLSAREEPFLCFQRRARGDVVLQSPESAADFGARAFDPGQPDWKILGSAQRRHRGAILQHGSLLLTTSAAAPELAGLSDLIGIGVEPRELSNLVSRRIASVLGLKLTPTCLPPKLELILRELANNKYGAAAWTNRR